MMNQNPIFTYRDATLKDAVTIAAIHTVNWQIYYRDVMSDDYLDHHIAAERLELWTKRLTHPTIEQKIMLVEADDTICGFACIFLAFDPQFGALIDNLHVLTKWQGYGLGKVLMQKAAIWVKEQTPNALIHLWVYAQNTAAIQFYEYIGGEKVEEKVYTNPDGSKALAYRMLWKPEQLI